MNHADSDETITLTVTGACNGAEPLSATDTTTLTVQPVPHSIVVAPSAAPATVPSGSSAALSAVVTDSRSAHSIVSWSWSDGGGGGTFAPSPEVASPTYTAPANNANTDVVITLTAAVTCGGPSPVDSSGSTTLIVQPVPHAIAVTVSAAPSTIASGATADLSASAIDSRGHGIAAWAWSDGGAGGAFLPSADIPNPQYRASGNLSGADVSIALVAVATCEGPYVATGAASVTLVVQSIPPGSTEADAMPLPLSLTWGQSADLSIGYRNLDAFSWQPDQGYHLQAEGKMDRWGVTSLPLTSEVAPGGSYTFDFQAVAPPLTTLKYEPSASQAAPGLPDSLACGWQFSRGDVVWNGGLVSGNVAVSRFSDIQPDLGDSASWAR
jgi:hypothetical protein